MMRLLLTAVVLATPRRATSTNATTPTNSTHNPYAIKSRKYFRETKMSRGDVNTMRAEKMRTWDYFRKYDWNDVEDTELAARADCGP